MGMLLLQLLASRSREPVEACFSIGVGDTPVGRNEALPFESLQVHATGTVDRLQGVTRFTEIVLHVRVTTDRESDRDRIKDVLDKSERTCLVAASLSTPVRLVPEVVVRSGCAGRAARPVGRTAVRPGRPTR